MDKAEIADALPGQGRKQVLIRKQSSSTEMRSKCVRARSVMEEALLSEDLSCLFGKTSMVDSQVSGRKERSRICCLPLRLRRRRWFSGESCLFVRLAFVPLTKTWMFNRLQALSLWPSALGTCKPGGRLSEGCQTVLDTEIEC